MSALRGDEAATNGVVPAMPVRSRNYDEVAELVAEKVKSARGRISAKRLSRPRHRFGE